MTDKKPAHTNHNQTIVLVGNNGVGKSSLIHMIIADYKKKRGDKASVIVLAPYPEQFGKMGILCTARNFESLLRGLYESQHSGLVVFDDADSYMTPASAMSVTEFVTTLRHRDNDVVLSTRSLQQLNINIRRTIGRLCVFNMALEKRARESVWDVVAGFKETHKTVMKSFPPQQPFTYFDFVLSYPTGVVVRKTLPVGGQKRADK